MIQEKPYRKKPNILVTGTPGTGKTTFAQLLNQSLNFIYIPVGELIKNHKLYVSWNQQYDVPEFDEELLLKYIQTNYDVNAGGLLIDFHSPDVFPEEYFDLVVLMRCQNEILYKRLEQRGYAEQKITENIECEIMEEIKLDLEEYYTDTSIIIELRNEQEHEMQANLEAVIAWLLAYKSKHSE